MKEITKKCLVFDVPINMYESAEEANQAAGKVGAFEEEGNNNLWYRGAANEAREIICKAVESLTGIPRETKQAFKDGKDENGNDIKVPALDSEGNEVFEFVLKEDPYVKVALAKSGKTVADLQPAVVEAVRAANEGRGIAVDIKRTERKPPQPKTLPTRFKDTANKFITEAKVDKFLKIYRKELGKDATDINDTAGAVDPVKLGWLVKELAADRERRTLEMA